MLHPELHEYLKQLGAEITPQGEITDVYIPGANNKFTFAPTGQVYGTNVKSGLASMPNLNAEEVENHINRGDIRGALYFLGHGTGHRNGPNHELGVLQVPTVHGPLRMMYRSLLKIGSNEEERNNNSIYHNSLASGGSYSSAQPPTPTHLSLIKSALQNPSVLGPLADYINENHANGAVDVRSHDDVKAMEAHNKKYKEQHPDSYSAYIENYKDYMTPPDKYTGLVVDFQRPVQYKKKLSKKWVSNKIRKLMGEGKGQKQAIAESLNMAGRSKYSAEKYAEYKVPVSKLMSKKLFPALQGTKLAAVLHEIHDTFGSHDTHLKNLADRAMRGVGDLGPKGDDTYTQIRDRLLNHSHGELDVPYDTPEEELAHQKRAETLAKNYNWHRVNPQSQVDEVVSDYINSISKNRLKEAGEQHRAAHNLFGIGSENRTTPISAQAREAFWQGLRNHVQNRAVGVNSAYGLSGADVTDELLKRSLRRLGEQEQDRANYKEHPRSKVPVINAPEAAWRKRGTGVSVNKGTLAQQYTASYENAIVEQYAAAPLSGGDLEKSAILRAMTIHGIDPNKLPKYIDAIRGHIQAPETFNDPLSQTYIKGMQNITNSSKARLWDATDAAHPLVGYYGYKFGDVKPKFNVYAPPVAQHHELLEPYTDIDILDDTNNNEHDFHIPEATPVEESIISKLPKVVNRTPFIKLVHMRHDIADELAKGAKYKGIIDMLMDKHDLDPVEAEKHFNNYKKLKNKPESLEKPPRMGRKEGPIRRRRFYQADGESEKFDVSYEEYLTPERYSKPSLYKQLFHLKPELAKAAQEIYDQWDASGEDGDPECGFGGICHEIANNMSDVLSKHGIDHQILDNNGMGEQHVWIGAHNNKDMFHIDIDPNHYETGGGYSWKKIPDVKFTPDHVDISPGEIEHLNLDDRYSAYRAPKGGMVVNGVSYIGGQTVPDLQKFGAMNNVKSRMKKLLQRKKFKKYPTVELPAWVCSYTREDEVEKYSDVNDPRQPLVSSRPIYPTIPNAPQKPKVNTTPKDMVYSPDITDTTAYPKLSNVPNPGHEEELLGYNKVGTVPQTKGPEKSSITEALNIHKQMDEHANHYADHLEAARRLRQNNEHGPADNALRTANIHYDIAELLHNHLSKLGMTAPHPRDYIGKHIEPRVHEYMMKHRTPI